MNENKISSGDEVQIDYLGRSTSLLKASTYDKFISSLVTKFFLTEEMKKGISFYYLDEDEDQIPLDNKNYDEFLKEAKKAILIIEEKAETDDKLDDNEENFDAKIKLIKEQVAQYKNKLNEICEKNIKDKLEEVDKKHKEELEQLGKLYKDKLEKYKNHIQEKTKEIFKEIQNQSTDILLKKLTEYNEGIEKELDQLIKNKENLVNNKVNELDIENLEKQQKEVGEIVSENKNLLQK